MKTKLLPLLALHLGLVAGVAQPVITDQPQWQTNFIGATATFSVGATGTPPLLYQWRKATASLPGQTNSTLVLTNLQLSQQALYSVVVSNLEGSVTSSAARLYVLTLPAITPGNPTASLFADLTFVGTSAPAGPVSYQWLLNGEPIPGAVTNRLAVTNVQKTNAGAYAFVVTYVFGSATSQVARLTITPFNSIYCFGFSWTDTGGNGCTWPLPDYYGNRACNGPMWPEFLSTNLGLAYVSANNYAVCGASSSDVLNQVTSYQPPAKPALSLHCVWVGDSEFLMAYPPNGFRGRYVPTTNEAAWEQIIDSIVLANSNAVDLLYRKGARTILIQNLDDFSEEPDAIASFGADIAGLARLSTYIERFNQRFKLLLNTYSQTRPDARFVWVDVWSNQKAVLADPRRFGFTNTRIDALSDPDLVDKSFGGPGADYYFWDGGHLSSKANSILSEWHVAAMSDAVPETIDLALSSITLDIKLQHLLIGRDYTLQRSTDLSQWNDLQAFTAAVGTNQVSQALETGTRSVFYRLQWQP